MPSRVLLLFTLISISLTTIWLTGCDQAAAAVQQQRLLVTGMHCDDCAKGIQQTVTGIEGVDSCQASYPSGEVLISFHGTDTMPMAIKRIESMGFTVNRRE